MDIEKYRKMYLVEAAEHLQKMAEQLVAVEADPEDQDGIDGLFREAHSLKGMAATMGYETTARLAHYLEDHLNDSRAQGKITGALIDHMLAGADLLEGLLEDIGKGHHRETVFGNSIRTTKMAPGGARCHAFVIPRN